MSGVIRNIALLLALALAQSALAQTAPTAAPKASPTKPAPAKPAAKKPAPPKPEAAAPGGPCIGVIPHIGEHFETQMIGLFSYEDKEVPIESWGLDDLVVARVRAAAGTRFTVRQLAYPANTPDPQGTLFHSLEDSIKGVVQTVAPAAECERYVIVVGSGSQFAGTRYSVKGIGIINSPNLGGGEGDTHLFALTMLYVIDGRTFAVLKKGVGSLDEGTNLSFGPFWRTSPIHGPSREVKDFTWPPAPNAMMSLREPTRALLAASLDKVLPGLLAP